MDGIEYLSNAISGSTEWEKKFIGFWKVKGCRSIERIWMFSRIDCVYVLVSTPVV